MKDVLLIFHGGYLDKIFGVLAEEISSFRLFNNVVNAAGDSGNAKSVINDEGHVLDNPISGLALFVFLPFIGR